MGESASSGWGELWMEGSEGSEVGEESMVTLRVDRFSVMAMVDGGVV